MPDNETIVAAGSEGSAGEGQGAEADLNKGTDAAKTGGEDAGEGQGTKGEGALKDPLKDQEGAKAQEKNSQLGEDDGAEPPMRERMSRSDFIQMRKKDKLIKELKSKTTDDDEIEDDEIAPADEELISKVVAKKFAPIIEKSIADDDNKEISDFLAENPDFKPFEAKVKRFMQHASRRSLPIKSIFYEVAGDQLLKIGAERFKTAEAKAKDSQTGGGSNRAGESGAVNDWNLTPEEFEAKQERIRRSQPNL